VRESNAKAPDRAATQPFWRRAPQLASPRPLLVLAHRVLAMVLVAAGALSGSVPQAMGQSDPPTEYQVKAAFLFNFAKFVEWPANAFVHPEDPIVLGIVGEDPFGFALDGMVFRKTVNGRSFMVKRLEIGPELRGCHILFISSSEKKNLAHILESLKGSSVLTVGETDQFVQSGGAIKLLLENNKVRFEVNVGAAAMARLKVSSKLLALARSVVDERTGGKS
jgi:hypothetical protein